MEPIGFLLGLNSVLKENFQAHSKRTPSHTFKESDVKVTVKTLEHCQTKITIKKFTGRISGAILYILVFLPESEKCKLRFGCLS